MKFRKKPVVVEAIQWDGSWERLHEIVKWAGHQKILFNLHYTDVNDVKIKTLEGTMPVSIGDWIIKGVKGEFYPIRNDIFEATYEAAEVKDGTP